MMDKITLLTSRNKRMTKTFTQNGQIGYDSAKWFEHDDIEIEDIFELSELLKWMEDKSDKLIIRGKLIEDRNPSRVLRRKDAWDGEQAYYEENPNGKSFVLADFDKFPAMEGLAEHERLEWLILQLPEYCHDVTYHYQWSSSAGVNGWAELSCHIWFWLEEPRTDTQAIAWARDTGVIDDAPCRTVQPNYTAAPIFKGVEDPLAGKSRSGLIRKGRDALCMPIVDEGQPVALIGPTGGYTATGTGFDTLLDDIGPRYHMPIQRAIASWVASTGTPTDTVALKGRIKARIMEAPMGASPKETYLNDRYLDSSINGAIRKFGSRNPDKTTTLPNTALERVRYKLTKGRTL